MAAIENRAISRNCSRAASRSSTISWARTSGSGRLSDYSRLSSLSQNMSRLSLSRHCEKTPDPFKLPGVRKLPCLKLEKLECGLNLRKTNPNTKTRRTYRLRPVAAASSCRVKHASFWKRTTRSQGRTPSSYSSLPSAKLKSPRVLK